VFEVDLRAGELRRNGLKVKLQEQPFQVLAQLLERPGEVVTRDDLRNRLWPADTFVDFDHSLNAAIKRLRDALSDSAENPTFVETVARRGYRFLAPVTTPHNGTSVPMLAPQPAAVVPKPGHAHFWWIGLASGIVLVLIGLKIGFSLAQHHTAAPAQVQVSQLTANPADDRVRSAAISPDGKYVAFSDETGFYLRQIETGETHPLTLPAGLSMESVGWFPDSAHMVVALHSDGQASALWEISALGGSARMLSNQGRSPAVSPDGRQIAFVNRVSTHNEIWLMVADGEGAHKLVGDIGDFFSMLAWAPDGRKIAYVRGRLSEGYGVTGTIEFVDPRDSRVSTLLQVSSMGWFAAVDGPLAWTRDGSLIYSLGEAPPRQSESNLWSVHLDRTGHPTDRPARLTSDAGVVTGISASEDGKRVVYVKGVPQPDVYVARIEGRASISEPVRLTLDDRQDIPFDWTLDGRSVLFISDRTGTFNIYRQQIDQTVPELLVGGDHSLLTARLNSDGTQLLYLVYPSWTDNITPISLMRLPLAGGAPQQVLQTNWVANQQCARAPATLCLYNVVGKGTFKLFSFDPMKGSGPQVYEIKDDIPQLYNWSLSPDGTMLAICKGKEGGAEPRIRLVPLNGGAERTLTIPGWSGVSAIDWAADSKSIWAASAGEDENALLNIDLQGHARVVWRPRKKSVYWAIPSRDGRYLALHVGSSSANVWMLERP
jgi:DNA-binding winged helix-turn-helix (wHTH) protein/Tol biopolymer transport system component